jgi:hypothetical protein
MDIENITMATVIEVNDEKTYEGIGFFPVDEDEYPDYYISRSGDILSTKCKEMRVLTPCLTFKGYYQIKIYNKNGDRCSRKVHRLLAKVFIDNPGGKPIVDHKDGNKKNNSLENLRWCTNQENTQNKVSHKNSSSKYRGISWKEANKKWQAQINIEGKKHHLGYFKSEHDAHLAYDAKAREIHGEFYRPHQDQ